MFSKMLVALCATAGLVVPAAMPARAEARPSIAIGVDVGRPAFYPPVVLPPPVIYHSYNVLYRRAHCEPWRVYGTYHSHHRAHDIEVFLESRGYDARVTHR